MALADRNPGLRPVSHMCGFAAALIGVAMLLSTDIAFGSPLDLVNAMRMEGCRRESAVGTVVRRDAKLDDVARELSKGGTLSDAVDRVAYPAATSTSFHVRGARDDATLRKILTDNYCKSINDAKYAELGAFQSGDQTWIVLAARFAAMPTLDPLVTARRVLELVNAARAQPRRCGRTKFGAVGPLSLSAKLTAAAATHARDMAQHGFLEHRGSDGTQSGDRITRAGYDWRASGENIASGQRDADAVVAAWLTSPGHCENIMAPQYTEMGLAFALAPGDPPIYWAQEFGAPH